MRGRQEGSKLGDNFGGLFLETLENNGGSREGAEKVLEKVIFIKLNKRTGKGKKEIHGRKRTDRLRVIGKKIRRTQTASQRDQWEGSKKKGSHQRNESGTPNQRSSNG